MASRPSLPFFITPVLMGSCPLGVPNQPSASVPPLGQVPLIVTVLPDPDTTIDGASATATLGIPANAAMAIAPALAIRRAFLIDLLLPILEPVIRHGLPPTTGSTSVIGCPGHFLTVVVVGQAPSRAVALLARFSLLVTDTVSAH